MEPGAAIPAAAVVVSTSDNMTFDLAPHFNYMGLSYVLEPPSCSKSCKLYCLFWMDWMNFIGGTDKKITYINKCTCCSAWQAQLDDQTVGVMRKAGLCDQTCKYIFCTCCCPCINCSCNDVVKIIVSDGDGNKRLKMTMRDNPCTRCCGPCADVLGSSCICCFDCCAYLNDNNAVVASEKIFNMEEPKVQVGTINSVWTIRMLPCCIPMRVPARMTVNMQPGAAPEGMAVTMALLPMMQAGLLQNPCSCLSCPLLPPASGACDCGREVTVRRMRFAEMMTETQAGAPATQIDDSPFKPVFEWNASGAANEWNPYAAAERALVQEIMEREHKE